MINHEKGNNIIDKDFLKNLASVSHFNLELFVIS